jgi:hypothetical protein
VIVKQKIYKRASNYYSHTHTHTHSAPRPGWYRARAADHMGSSPAFAKRCERACFQMHKDIVVPPLIPVPALIRDYQGVKGRHRDIRVYFRGTDTGSRVHICIHTHTHTHTHTLHTHTYTHTHTHTHTHVYVSVCPHTHRHKHTHTHTHTGTTAGSHKAMPYNTDYSLGVR